MLGIACEAMCVAVIQINSSNSCIRDNRRSNNRWRSDIVGRGCCGGIGAVETSSFCSELAAALLVLCSEESMNIDHGFFIFALRVPRADCTFAYITAVSWRTLLAVGGDSGEHEVRIG